MRLKAIALLIILFILFPINVYANDTPYYLDQNGLLTVKINPLELKGELGGTITFSAEITNNTSDTLTVYADASEDGGYYDLAGIETMDGVMLSGYSRKVITYKYKLHPSYSSRIFFKDGKYYADYMVSFEFATPNEGEKYMYYTEGVVFSDEIYITVELTNVHDGSELLDIKYTDSKTFAYLYYDNYYREYICDIREEIMIENISSQSIDETNLIDFYMYRQSSIDIPELSSGEHMLSNIHYKMQMDASNITSTINGDTSAVLYLDNTYYIIYAEKTYDVQILSPNGLEVIIEPKGIIGTGTTEKIPCKVTVENATNFDLTNLFIDMNNGLCPPHDDKNIILAIKAHNTVSYDYMLSPTDEEFLFTIGFVVSEYYQDKLISWGVSADAEAMKEGITLSEENIIYLGSSEWVQDNETGKIQETPLKTIVPSSTPYENKTEASLLQIMSEDNEPTIPIWVWISLASISILLFALLAYIIAKSKSYKK